MPILWYRPQTAAPLEKQVTCMCKDKKNQKDSPSKLLSIAKYVWEWEQEESSDSDFTFQVREDKPLPSNCATVEVRVNEVK